MAATPAPGAAQGLAEQAYQQIKERIMRLHYAPGSALSEAGLAAALQIGRMPVRMAVKKLKSEGWLTAEFRCQIKVKAITADDVREIYQLRRILEEQALQLIFSSGQTWDYSFRLEEKLLQVKAAGDDLFAREVAESAWHLAMIAVFASSRITQVYQNIQEEAIRIAYGYMRLEDPAYVGGIISGLEAFCLALRAQDYEQARAILERDHWQGGLNHALQAIQS